jgi:endonuclease/exonuclease/phosphatase (EEP) superfamily protein YafD
LPALVTVGTLFALVLGAVGQFVRDRGVLLALMMYVPLPLVGAGAVVFDLLRRGRLVRRFRFGLAGAGLVAAVAGGLPMLGMRPPDLPPPDSVPVTLLHWNVMWGGRDPARWRQTAEHILRRNPDIVVLSEAPSDERVTSTLSRLGPGWEVVYITNEPGSRYWYNPMVCARAPLKLERRVPLRNGAAMSVLAALRGRTVRLLVVDGVSSPRVLRTSMLEDVAAACDEAALRGEPVDVVVGDFNSMGRSLGFDAVASSGGAGYRRASEYCRGWRATWPSPLPLYDIDHVWVRNGVAVLGCELFADVPATDHRGQFVRLALPVQ